MRRTAFLLAGIAAYMSCFWVLGDDHWWHMLTARVVLETGRVPAADPFSFTFRGAPWTNWEWLAGVVMYLGWEAGGALGLVALRAVSLSGTVLIAVWHWRRLNGRFLEAERGRELAAFLLGAALLLVAQVRTADRPHTYAYLLLAGAHALATRLRERWSTPAAAGLVALFAVWVNFHPSWILGMALCGAVFADALLEDRSLGRRLIPLGLAMAGTVLLTPQIGRFGDSVADIFRDQVSAEWAPVWKFLTPGHLPLVTFLLVAAFWIASGIASVVRSRPRSAVFQSLLLACLLVQAFRHAMLTPVFVIAAVPYLRPDLLGWPRASLQQRTERLASVLAAALVLALAQRTMASYATFGIGIDPRRNPVAQTEFLRANGLGGKVYCTSKEAHGYVAFHLWPAATIYIDGRVPQVFPASFLETYVKTGEPEILNREIDRWGIDHVVLTSGLFAPINAQVAEILRARGDFGLVYYDENGAVWSRLRGGSWPCAGCRPFRLLDPYRLVRPEEASLIRDTPELRTELERLAAVAPGSRLARELAANVRRQAGLPSVP